MNKKHYLMILMILPFLFAPVAGQTWVDESPKGFFIGPFLGFQKSSDAEDGKLYFGGMFDARFHRYLGAELTVGYREQDYLTEAINVKDVPVTATVKFYPFTMLYVGAGVGLYNASIDYTDQLIQEGLEEGTEHEWGWHVSAGAELPLTERIKLAGGIRYTGVDIEYHEGKIPGTEDIDSDFYAITIGALLEL